MNVITVDGIGHCSVEVVLTAESRPAHHHSRVALRPLRPLLLPRLLLRQLRDSWKHRFLQGSASAKSLSDRLACVLIGAHDGRLTTCCRGGAENAQGFPRTANRSLTNMCIGTRPLTRVLGPHGSATETWRRAPLRECTTDPV